VTAGIRVKLASFGSDEKRTVMLIVGKNTILIVSLKARAERTKAAFDAWQAKTWTALRAAALALHNEEQARLQQERDRLWQALAGKDTLRLRRLEREELLRLIMQWLLGPSIRWLHRWSNRPCSKY
jgi:hypothetical protein